MWTLEILKKMKMEKGNNRIDAFTTGKLKLVNNVLLYYNFLYADGEMVLAEYPTQWIRDDFRQWKTLGYPVNTAALNISQTGNKANTNTTLQASNTIAPISQTKLEENAYMSWRLSKQDETLYPVLENDQEYTNWIIKTKHWFTSEECHRIIDPNFQDNQFNGGADTL